MSRSPTCEESGKFFFHDVGHGSCREILSLAPSKAYRGSFFIDSCSITLCGVSRLSSVGRALDL
jgi:hypothetical protein